MRKLRLFGIVVLFLLFIAFSIDVSGENYPVLANDDEVSNVLILHSYHEGYKWTDDIDRGIKDVIAGDANVITEYMDTKRNFTDDSFYELFELYYDRYSEIDFDVIIVSDDNAFNFMNQFGELLFPDAPYVFTGVNYFDPDEHVIDGYTGVNEGADIDANIELITDLHPDVETIYLIHDLTTTGMRVKSQLLEVVDDYQDINFVWLNDISMEDIEIKLSDIDEDAIVFYTFFFRDSEGNFFEYDESIERISQATPQPIYGAWDFSLGHGIVGGMLTSGYEQGFFAARKANRILGGIDVDSIPILMESPNRFYFDNEQIHKFEIPVDKLPEGSNFINTLRTETTFASSLIKLRALEIEGDIRNYLRSGNYSIEQLQNDETFWHTAVQRVGETGYSAVFDSNTGQLYFHPRSDLVNESLDYFDDFPELQNIFRNSIGDTCQESSGYYNWLEEDGTITEKYVHVTCVDIPTSDGKNLFVAATTYIDEYEINLDISQTVGRDLNETDTMTSALPDLSSNLIYIVPFLIFLTFMIFSYFSISEKTESKLAKDIKLYIISSNFMISFFMLRLIILDLNIGLFAVRAIYIGLIFFFFFFMLLTLNLLGISINQNLKRILLFLNVLLSFFILFTNFFVKTVFINPEFYEKYGVFDVSFGPLFWLPTLFYLFYLLYPAYFLIFDKSVRNSKQNKRISKDIAYGYFIYSFFAIVALLIQPGFYASSDINSLFLIYILAIIFAIILVLFLIKHSFIVYESNLVTKIIMLSFIFIIILVGTSTYRDHTQQVESELRLATQRNCQNLLLQIDYFKDFFEGMKSSLLVQSEYFYDETIIDNLIRTYKFQEDFVYGAYYVNSSGHIEELYPFDESAHGADISYQAHIIEMNKNQIPLISGSFMAVEGFTGIVVYVPLFREGTYDGMLGYLIDLDELESKLRLDSIDDTFLSVLIDHEDKIVFSTDDNIKGNNSDALSKYTDCYTAQCIDEFLDGRDRAAKDILINGTNYRILIHDFEIIGKNWKSINIFSHENLLYQSGYTSNLLYQGIFVIFLFIILGILANFGYNYSLREEVKNKTDQLKKFNKGLSKEVEKRTKEIKLKSAQIEKLNQNLKKEVENKTKELERKLKKEKKNSDAMVFLLEKTRYMSENIKIKNEELKKVNYELEKAHKELEKEKKQVEQKVELKTRNLRLANQKINKILQSKTEFLNQVAHDLRTPLTPIALLLDNVLKQGKFDKKTKERLDIIHRNVHSLKYLITDVLNLVRIDSGKDSINLEKINLKNLVDEFIELNEIRFKHEKIDVKSNIKKNIFVNIERDKILEVIGNIVSNSSKFFDKKQKMIEFNIQLKRNQVVLLIKDNGVGVEKDKVKKIFEEFYQVGQYQGGKSNGLGLAICRKIIEQHGGKIWADSEGIGKGLTIFFSLPIKNKK